MRLFTIGYEGATLSDFLSTLKQSKIDLLLDVRELPLSRRKGFSKTALREALASQDIDYRHERRLGSPKPVRQRLYQDGDYKTFFRDFGKHLKDQQDLLDDLADELTGNIVLVCYEKDYRTCHRTAVADALATRTDAVPCHLDVIAYGQDQAHQPAYSDLSQSLSSA